LCCKPQAGAEDRDARGPAQTAGDPRLLGRGPRGDPAGCDG
jgi:hypothetical protein